MICVLCIYAIVADAQSTESQEQTTSSGVAEVLNTLAEAIPTLGESFEGEQQHFASLLEDRTPSLGITVAFGSTTDCSYWQNEYKKAEQHVIKLYNDIKEMQRKQSADNTSVNQTALTRMKKIYRDAQKNLKQWRTNANSNGCTISASAWETKSI